MHFASAALTTSALALASATLGQDTTYPPGGPGIIRVRYAGQSEFTGCLNQDGRWTVVNECAEVFGNGQGGISGPIGWIIINEDSVITQTPTTWTNAWVGTHVDGGRNASDLIANPDVEEGDDEPHGGPVWYSGIPTTVEDLDVSGVQTDELSVAISLFFQSSFE